MNYSILVVDDSMPMRSVIKKTFRTAGYGGCEFHEAGNGMEALEVIRNNWIDIVITDYNMPVMNGLDLLWEMKKHEMAKELPVVVISTEGSREKIDRFMELGAAGYITKPFTPETVRDVITRILGEGACEDEFDDGDEDLDF
ncbi:MAG: response regulator [Desulfobacteraceae bacterium]|nr:response regulator [Desulfobacteraceae bacterium]